MAVKKRNDLASMASIFVPAAIENLRIAERNIEEKKYDEASKWIAEAVTRLDHLRKAFADACAERTAEEAGRLTGED
jgi:hypothetical protein